MKLPFRHPLRSCVERAALLRKRAVGFCRPARLGSAVLGALLAVGSVSAARAQVVATLTTLHSFDGSDGNQPVGNLTLGSDGNLYGVTLKGGVNRNGTIFEVTPTGGFTLLHSFDGSDGDSPNGGLLLGSDGNFYGTTYDGGTLNLGTVFQLTPAGGFTSLYSFDNAIEGLDGEHPTAGLVQGSNGSFYGTTGGDEQVNDFGTAYEITPAGVFDPMQVFNGRNGEYPNGGLVLAGDGNFYGTTIQGGPPLYIGTAFQLTPDGVITTLHIFNGTEGSYPTAGLTLGRDGNFYGTTNLGGANDEGTIFQLTPAGGFTSLYTFSGSDGVEPGDALVLGSDGNFYGTTSLGGANNAGTIFQITPAGTLTTLYSFNTSDGSSPDSGLVQGSDGSFYGTTNGGGTDNKGTVFKLTVSGEPAHPAFFTGEVALANGVYYLSFPTGNYFGYYSFLANPAYIYHFDLGFEYVFDANDGQSGVYFYDFASSTFFYTSPTFPFPYLYDFTLNSVLYYYPDPNNAGYYNTDGVRYFYDFNTGAIITK